MFMVGWFVRSLVYMCLQSRNCIGIGSQEICAIHGGVVPSVYIVYALIRTENLKCRLMLNKWTECESVAYLCSAEKIMY